MPLSSLIGRDAAVLVDMGEKPSCKWAFRYFDGAL
jgi:hypothetical protein